MTPKPRRPIPRVSAKKAALGHSWSTIPARTTKPRRKNLKRSADAFAHAYHSKARVAFVKSLPCLVCASLSGFFAEATAGRSENAHTGKKPGKGLKAHYSTISPLCAGHHRMYDEHRAPLDTPAARKAIADFAPRVESAWLTYSGVGV